MRNLAPPLKDTVDAIKIIPCYPVSWQTLRGPLPLTLLPSGWDKSLRNTHSNWM